jgi:OOP family OmpA-OmpF porin
LTFPNNHFRTNKERFVKTLIASLLLVTSPLLLADNDPRTYVGASVGATITDHTDYDPGPTFHLLIGTPLSQRLSLEANVIGTKVDVANLAASDDYERLTLGFDLRALIWGDHERSAYLLAGVNGHQIDFLGEELGGYGGNLGLGMLNRLGQHLELRAEARYSLDEINGEGIVPDDSFYTYSVLVGLNYRFGTWPPIPVYDTDGDGVNDKQDQCPNTPLGTQVNKAGCPLDSDQDGVANWKDQCPKTPHGTRVNAVGCSIDKDGDGVLNTSDDCPNTYPGLKVNQRGCVVQAQTLTVHNIHFAFDDDALLLDSVTVLNKMAATLIEQPKLSVTVAGHADSVGDQGYNKRLSAKRAHSVVNHLADQGVNRTRLHFVGYGEEKPIATNDTEEGRALNRRVEFVIH